MTDHTLVTSLLRPGAYPWKPDSVDLIETHISWVFLAGRFVVKVKRPVQYGFVDHTTVEARRQSCADEVRLNRRLTDDVYLSVVPITQSEDGCEVDGKGQPLEWATLMRRLPAEEMLDRVLTGGAPLPDLADRLADRLIPFHQGATPVRDPAILNSVAAIVPDNLNEVAVAAPSLGKAQVALTVEAMRAFLENRYELFTSRIEDGWIREGHGDLRAEHICLEPNGAVQIFDCVEFSAAIRYADVASDLAFLLMDLDRVGASDIADQLLERYRAAGFEIPQELVRFYRAHRALVRAKVAWLTLVSDPESDRPVLRREAATYLHLATRDAVTVRPFVIAMTGLSGTGKSTVAEELAQATGARLLSTDAIRKELTGTVGFSPTTWQTGIYAGNWTDQTYARLFEVAEATVRGGVPVILDGTFLDTSRREQAKEVAETCSVPLLFVETVCDEETTLRRITDRARRGNARSDATVEVYRRQQASLTSLQPGLPTGAVAVRIDTTRDGPADLGSALVALKECGALTGSIFGGSVSASLTMGH